MICFLLKFSSQPVAPGRTDQTLDENSSRRKKENEEEGKGLATTNLYRFLFSAEAQYNFPLVSSIVSRPGD